MARFKSGQKPPQKVVNKEQKKDKKRKDRKIHPNTGGLYYSFLTVVLLLCLIHLDMFDL